MYGIMFSYSIHFDGANSIIGLTNTLLFPRQKTVYGASVVIFEGIMSFADKELLQVSEGYRPHRTHRMHCLSKRHRGHICVCPHQGLSMETS